MGIYILVTLTILHEILYILQDAVFGHQAGEINFWMPLTPTHETSCLYAETKPEKGDWYPFHPLKPGEIMRFPGTFCRHKTIPNVSGKTRVSIDFRCSMSTCFDKNYQGRAIMSRRHEMLEVSYRAVKKTNNEMQINTARTFETWDIQLL